MTLTFLPEGSDDWTTAATGRSYWLPWDSGFVSETAMLGSDVFSGPFSGCWMMAYRDGPMTYVGHIGTDSSRPDNTRAAKRAWHAFATGHEGDLVTGFNACRDYTGPFPPRTTHERPQLYGLMTAAFRCYTICVYQQVNTQPLTYRIIAIKESAGDLYRSGRDIFRNDPEVHDMGLPFTLDDWKTSTSRGGFHTRSKQLKALDTALEAYFKKPCVPTLTDVRTKFDIWRREKKSEYQSPTRNRRNCITDLGNYLAAN
jgi:hypothetical protein